MAADTLKIAVFAEHCNRAGQLVPVDRVGEIDYDSPDYWVWTGTREELLDQATDILREASVRSAYISRCARTVMDAIGHDWVWRIRIHHGLDISDQFLEDWDEDGEPIWTADAAIAYRFSTAKEAAEYEYPNTITEPVAVPRY